MKRILGTLYRKWPEYLIESIVIIASILGAYSLDNWNDIRKGDLHALEILDKISQDLQSTKVDVKLDIKRHGDCLIAANRIYAFLDSEQEYYDSLDLFFEQITFDYTIQYSDVGFRSLESYGFEIIKNKELLNHLSFFFEQELQIILRIDERKFLDKLLPYYSENFEISTSGLESLGETNGKSFRSSIQGGFRPLDIQHLKSNSQLKILIREVIYERTERIQFYNYINGKIENLQADIDLEMSKF